MGLRRLRYGGAVQGAALCGILATLLVGTAVANRATTNSGENAAAATGGLVSLMAAEKAVSSSPPGLAPSLAPTISMEESKSKGGSSGPIMDAIDRMGSGAAPIQPIPQTVDNPRPSHQQDGVSEEEKNLKEWNKRWFALHKNSTPDTSKLIQGMMFRTLTCPEGNRKLADCEAKVGIGKGCDQPERALLVCCRNRESEDCAGAHSANNWVRYSHDNNGRMGLRVEVSGAAWGVHKWGAVCADAVSKSDAEAICRELQLPTGLVTFGSWGGSDAPPTQCQLPCQHGGYAKTEGHTCKCMCPGWKWAGAHCEKERVLDCSELMNYYIDPRFRTVAKDSSVTTTQLQSAWFFNVIDFPGVRRITSGPFASMSEFSRRQPNIGTCLEKYRNTVRTSSAVLTPQFVSDTMGLPLDNIWKNMGDKESKMKMLLDWMLYAQSFNVHNHRGEVEKFREWLGIPIEDCPWNRKQAEMQADHRTIDKDLAAERQRHMRFDNQMVAQTQRLKGDRALMAEVTRRVNGDVAADAEMHALKRNMEYFLGLLHDGISEVANQAATNTEKLHELSQDIPTEFGETDSLRVHNTNHVMSVHVGGMNEAQKDIEHAIKTLRDRNSKVVHTVLLPLAHALEKLELFRVSLKKLKEGFKRESDDMNAGMHTELHELQTESEEKVKNAQWNMNQRLSDEIKEEGLKGVETKLRHVAATAEGQQNTVIRGAAHRLDFASHVQKGFILELKRNAKYSDKAKQVAQAKLAGLNRKAHSTAEHEREDLAHVIMQTANFGEEINQLQNKLANKVTMERDMVEKESSIAEGNTEKKLKSSFDSKTRFLQWLLDTLQEQVEKLRVSRTEAEDKIAAVRDKMSRVEVEMNEQKSGVNTLRDNVLSMLERVSGRIKWLNNRWAGSDEKIAEMAKECKKWAHSVAHWKGKPSAEDEVWKHNLKPLVNFKNVLHELCMNPALSPLPP